MANGKKSIVDQAIEECVEALVRGVQSHSLAAPDVKLADDIVQWLKTSKKVRTPFEDQLAPNSEKWKQDGPRVCRAAFHAGSLAAFRAFSEDATEVSRDHVKEALRHIGSICNVRFGMRWIYCPIWPVPPTS